ncbi:hypothetical protein [Amycolatopsis sp. H20-H5]|uniref:hypothetical protein n=1 Tax=Amycolatopsis sp. H20-H5 TaxID=3046309 RepID=UPI002DBF4BAD|nr:hypothetical protein [Amycolatopsis sp. H20-H5]MEC3976791.1 hypothetical protein [Amycolatopsis sp. H20-H5]
MGRSFRFGVFGPPTIALGTDRHPILPDFGFSANPGAQVAGHEAGSSAAHRYSTDPKVRHDDPHAVECGVTADRRGKGLADNARARVKTIGAATMRELRDQHLLAGAPPTTS